MLQLTGGLPKGAPQAAVPVWKHPVLEGRAPLGPPEASLVRLDLTEERKPEAQREQVLQAQQQRAAHRG